MSSSKGPFGKGGLEGVSNEKAAIASAAYNRGQTRRKGASWTHRTFLLGVREGDGTRGGASVAAMENVRLIELKEYTSNGSRNDSGRMHAGFYGV